MRKAAILVLAIALASLVAGCAANPSQQTASGSQSNSSLQGDSDANSQDEAVSYAYSVEEVGFERDGKRIYGNLYLPDAEGPLPIVVISHGFGGDSSHAAGYAKAFAEHGIAACAFDFCGGGPGSRSDGDMTEMSVLTEAADLNAVVDGLLVREDVDPSRLFLFGGSQGGFVSTYVAATRPADVRALVALYPAYVIQDDAWNRTPDPDAIPETMSLMGMTVGRAYNADAMSFDIYGMMPGYPGDVLIVHGTADGIVPISYSERAAVTFPSAELARLEGAGHGLHGADEERAAQLAVGFVEAHLGGVTRQPDATPSLAMTVTVNGKPFSATAEDTEAGRELAPRLPLALDMSELNGVEKYSYTGVPFGGEAEVPATIAAGDIMAYSGDCLVLFYVPTPTMATPTCRSRA